ncbi:MAG TPA: hypothetical protein VEZ90_11685, partial [Blastocatellia bacterium]|nr:hypothetical protein [Blastocatellia bacterium]
PNEKLGVPGSTAFGHFLFADNGVTPHLDSLFNREGARSVKIMGRYLGQADVVKQGCFGNRVYVNLNQAEAPGEMRRQVRHKPRVRARVALKSVNLCGEF